MTLRGHVERPWNDDRQNHDSPRDRRHASTVFARCCRRGSARRHNIGCDLGALDGCGRRCRFLSRRRMRTVAYVPRKHRRQEPQLQHHLLRIGQCMLGGVLVLRLLQRESRGVAMLRPVPHQRRRQQLHDFHMWQRISSVHHPQPNRLLQLVACTHSSTASASPVSPSSSQSSKTTAPEATR